MNVDYHVHLFPGYAQYWVPGSSKHQELALSSLQGSISVDVLVILIDMLMMAITSREYVSDIGGHVY